ncbi:MAG: transcriptional repressor [Candidatus Thermoplasmatota archaeon]|jgi:Fe2+ or Zn2+ uptake regulation protein|nr:transcriptional repressor [Candidatus Thermoplasmatota archaeon]MCL5790933.1 transcriptional repressor [Candidatus Thermoplasmatota archaeon]
MGITEEQIKNHGLKVTPQRVKILEYIKRGSGDHFSAENIHEYVKKENPNIPAATVYNILKVFTERGLINSFEVNGRAMYEGRVEPHINFYCQSCGKIYDSEIQGDLKQIESDVKGKILSSTVLVRGICEECLTAEKENEIVQEI